MIILRTARPDDARPIQEIYAPFVLSTAVTFETEVPSVKETEIRMKKCLQKFPWIVCEVDGKVSGYAYASAHREREAYQWTCESSIYLHPDMKGKGVGKVLYQTLFSLLKRQGFVTVYGGITLPNEPSVKLHEGCGLECFAVYENVGYKLDSWHKVGWWKLQLNEYKLEPSPPLPFFQLDQKLVAAHYANAASAIQSKFIG
ncbi:MAG: N-acetyltransferase family protein [Chitinophagaceae bacterium]|nr:MAG: N-acetyltransferase family protein [Chitinophagaceae bacterium]